MTIRLPSTTVNILPASQQPLNQAQKILFIGQKTSDGTAVAGDLYENILNDKSWDTLFGTHSMLAAMIRAAKKINNISQMDAIALVDGGTSTSASGSLDFDDASSSGTITLSIGSSINNTYTMDISGSATANEIMTYFVNATTADHTCPVALIPGLAGTATVVALNLGTEGNFITLAATSTVPSNTVDIVSMTGAAGTPTLTGLFDPIEKIRYQTIVYPSTYDITPLKTLLDSRFNVTNNVLDGAGVLCVTSSVSNLITLLDAKNDPNLTYICNLYVSAIDHKGSAICELNTVIASEFAAIRALRLTNNADISRYVISANGSRDNFGGMAIASLPYFNTPFYNLPVVSSSHELADDEMLQLKNAGGTILENNPNRTTIICGEAVTTYKTDLLGNNDLSYKYLEYVDTIVNIREFIYNDLRTTYAQSRLTTGDVQPNRNMANAPIISAHVDSLYYKLGTEDYVLTQIGIDSETGIDWLEYFKQNKTVTLDLSTGTVHISMKMPIVTQLRTIVANMQIAFSTDNG
jgi:phage tail sheath gpL-like